MDNDNDELRALLALGVIIVILGLVALVAVNHKHGDCKHKDDAIKSMQNDINEMHSDIKQTIKITITYLQNGY